MAFEFKSSREVPKSSHLQQKSDREPVKLPSNIEYKDDGGSFNIVINNSQFNS